MVSGIFASSSHEIIGVKRTKLNNRDYSIPKIITLTDDNNLLQQQNQIL